MSPNSAGGRAALGLRVFLIAVIVALIGLVSYFVIRRASRPPVVRPETKTLTEQKVDRNENIEFAKTTGGPYLLSVDAPVSAIGSDGLYHWTGTKDKPFIVIESRTKKDNRLRFRIEAAEGVSDKEQNHVELRGGVKIVIEGITVKGTTFTFDNTKNVIFSDDKVTFEGTKFRGECRRVRYDLSGENLLFYGGVSLWVTAWTNDPVPLVFDGAEIAYERSSRTGRISGDVKMTHGKSRGRADAVDFAQFVDKDGFRLFEFLGAVTIDADERRANRPAPVHPPAQAAAPGTKAAAFKDEDLIFFQGGRQHVEAGSIKLLPFPGEEWLHVISIKGGGSVEIINDDGRKTKFEAGELEFLYSPDGALRDFNLRGNVRITGEAEGQLRLIEAPRIDYNANAGDMVTSGGERSRTISGGREVTAAAMVINLRTNNFRMSGEVRIVSEPGKTRDAVLFNSNERAFMTAGEVFYDAEAKAFILSKRARLWQGRDSLEADDLEINEGNGAMTASGAVRSVFFHLPKGKDKEERIEVTGDELIRHADGGRVVYRGGCTLTVAAIVLKAGRLILDPDEKETGKFKRIYADLGRVTIVQAMRKADGDLADYNLADDVIVLTGNIVLEDKEKGTVSRGGKLTFHPADGRMEIEHQDPERSTTVIKS